MSLISAEYLDLQRQMHAAPRGYGHRGDKWAEWVSELARQGDGPRPTILDYGCGQGSLGRALRAGGFEVEEYDPAIPGKDALPAPAQLVVCTDVLEHIEPDHIEAVLDHLRGLTIGRLFVVISLVPAGKSLPDGRNAHILLRAADWWEAHLARRFGRLSVVPCREHKEIALLCELRGKTA